MKKQLLLIVLLCTVCTPRSIERAAQKYDADTPLSDLLYSYLYSYLRYPESTDDLLVHLLREQGLYGEGCFDYSFGGGGDTERLKKLLNRGQVKMSAYQDSCFLYIGGRYKIGAVKKGRPLEWTQNRLFRFQDYLWWQYSPCFLDKNGLAILDKRDFIGDAPFMHDLALLNSKYPPESRLFIERDGVKRSALFLCEYSQKTGLKILEGPPEIQGAIDKCNVYIQALSGVLSNYLSNNPDVEKIRFIKSFYEDNYASSDRV